MAMRSFSYVLPTTLAEASSAAKISGAVLKAGGVDLLDLMKGDIIAPQRLVNLLSVPDPALRAIAKKEDGLHIGALATLADVARHADVPPVLARAAGLAATPQIRNTATVGGNLAQRVRCWWFRSHTFPCARKEGSQCFAQSGENKYHAIFDNADCAAVQPSSLASPLVVLDAQVVTTARTIPMADFFVPTTKEITRENVLDPGEIITHVLIPTAALAWMGAYREATERDSSDWHILSAAVTLAVGGNGVVTGARVALGGVAVVPYRVPAVEKALVGSKIGPGTAIRAAALGFQNAKPLQDNGYKIPLGKAILKRAILGAAGQPELVRQGG